MIINICCCPYTSGLPLCAVVVFHFRKFSMWKSLACEWWVCVRVRVGGSFVTWFYFVSIFEFCFSLLSIFLFSFRTPHPFRVVCWRMALTFIHHLLHASLPALSSKICVLSILCTVQTHNTYAFMYIVQYGPSKSLPCDFNFSLNAQFVCVFAFFIQKLSETLVTGQNRQIVICTLLFVFICKNIRNVEFVTEFLFVLP